MRNVNHVAYGARDGVDGGLKRYGPDHIGITIKLKFSLPVGLFVVRDAVVRELACCVVLVRVVRRTKHFDRVLLVVLLGVRKGQLDGVGAV
nr:hypothetical protein [uncultured Megasphaera sp.]